MSIQSPPGGGIKSLYEKTKEFGAPPFAATAAMVPWFPGFIRKSALQLGQTPPPIRAAQFIQGCSAAPVIGTVTGIQLVTQSLIKKRLFPEEKETPVSAVTSSLVVGSISAPFLAIFNGKTMNLTARQSLRALSTAQAGAIITRETSFLASFPMSSFLARTLNEKFGERPTTTYIAAFISGFLGSAIGHPADTALTHWQKGVTIERPSHLIRGLFTKSVVVGGFAMTYKAIQEAIERT